MRNKKRRALVYSSKIGMINTCCFLAVAISLVCLAEEQPHFERISTHQFPALVFIQEDINCVPSDRSSLMIATFDNGKTSVQKVMTSEYVKAIQLTDTVFLLEAKDQRPLWRQAYFLVDFQTGSHVLLAKSQSREKPVNYCCLRSDPDNNKAVILRYGQETDKSTLIQVDLTTLDTTKLYTLPKTDATLGFYGPHIKISPDFKLIAAMVSSGQQTPVPSRQSRYSLRVLDLETMKTTVLDDEVVVEISPISSYAHGRPPFEWIGPQDILYQHMIPDQPKGNGLTNEGQYVLKCANVGTKKITEQVSKRLRLTLNGGNMSRNWLTGELRYHDFCIDDSGHTLVLSHPCYSLDESNGIEIRFHKKVLYHHSGHPFVQPCASHSQKHFAYFVRLDCKPYTPTVYAKTSDMERPMVVAEVPFYTTLITWIEDTSNLRKKQPNEFLNNKQ